MAFRNIQVDLDDAVFQAALNRATSEGKAIGQVIAEFLRQYVDGMTTGSPTTYTIQSGDTLGKIAGEKAGIIKRATPVITGVKQPDAIQVVKAKQVILAMPTADSGKDSGRSAQTHSGRDRPPRRTTRPCAP